MRTGTMEVSVRQNMVRLYGDREKEAMESCTDL